MATPIWWPAIVAAADRRRHVTGLLLAHATPALADGVLHLRFTDPDIAQAWQESGAQAALEGALAADGMTMPVHAVVTSAVVSGA